MKSFIQILITKCQGQSMFTREDVEQAFNSYLYQQVIVENI